MTKARPKPAYIRRLDAYLAKDSGAVSPQQPSTTIERPIRWVIIDVNPESSADTKFLAGCWRPGVSYPVYRTLEGLNAWRRDLTFKVRDERGKLYDVHQDHAIVVDEEGVQ